MKLIIHISLFVLISTLILVFGIGNAQSGFTEMPFERGEVLKYRVHYGFINAGEAIINIDDKFHRVNNRDCYRVNVFGQTTGVFDWTLRVRDTWRTYMDRNSLMTQKFFRHIEEGNYYTEETSVFLRDKNKVKVLETKREGQVKKDKTYNINNLTHDIVSGFYYMRTINFNDMKPGDFIPMNAFYEDSTYNAEIKYLGKEVIRTKFGKKSSHVFTPVLPQNEFFENNENSILVYFSDDKNQIPLKIKAELFIGAVECDIKAYKGLVEKL